MNSIAVLFSFLRSGGTLANQLLGVHPACLVLSEVNPAGAVCPIWSQASDWLALVDPKDVEHFQWLSYTEQIRRLHGLAQAQGKNLIIRDWVTINFLQAASPLCTRPSGMLEQFVYLAHAGLEIRPVAVVRRAKRVYGSTVKYLPQLRSLPKSVFAEAYLAYARSVHAFPKIKLEALQSQPVETLRELLRTLGLALDHIDEQLAGFANFQRCTGNNTLPARPKSAGFSRIEITHCEDNVADDEEWTLAITEADRLMGYERHDAG